MLARFLKANNLPSVKRISIISCEAAQIRVTHAESWAQEFHNQLAVNGIYTDVAARVGPVLMLRGYFFARTLLAGSSNTLLGACRTGIVNTAGSLLVRTSRVIGFSV